jgi:predicted O-methyltransferase YrrM
LYGLTGKKGRGVECIAKLEKRKELEPEVSLNFDFAVVYMGLKDYDKVFEYLDNAYEERAGGLIFLHSIYWHPLKNDHRYATLVQKMGLGKTHK